MVRNEMDIIEETIHNLKILNNQMIQLEKENQDLKETIKRITEWCFDVSVCLEDFQNMLSNKDYEDILKEYKAKSPDDFVRKMVKKCNSFYLFLIDF